MLAHHIQEPLRDNEGLLICTQHWTLPNEARLDPRLERTDLPKPVHDDCHGTFFSHAGRCYASRQASSPERAQGVTLTDPATNVLDYGDNLDILRHYLPDAAVDLVYLDPPFSSNRDATSSSATSRARHAMPSCWPSRTPGTQAEQFSG
jgi:hypothetical protein